MLRQRIVELTAMVERMQQEVQAQESGAARGRRGGEGAASPPPEPDWWEANASLLAAIVGLPLLIAAGLLWKRRRDAARDDRWRPTRAPAHPRADGRRMRARRPCCATRRPGCAQADAGSRGAGARTTTRTGPPRAGAGDALAVSELSHVTEEARVYVALGHHDRAIEVLHEHIRQLPRSMPAAWLMLLDLYHATGRRQEFRRLAEEFHLHFNVQTPLWEGFAADEPGSGGLEAFPHIVKQVVDLWRKPECRAYLERLLYDNREGRRTGFPLSTYADILMLLQVLDAPEPVDIDLDLVGRREARSCAARAGSAIARARARGDARGADAGAKADAAGSVGIGAPAAAAHPVRNRPGRDGARRRRQAAADADATPA